MGVAFDEVVEELHLRLVTAVFFIWEVHSEAPHAAFAACAALFEEWGPRVAGLTPAWCDPPPQASDAATRTVDFFVFLSSCRRGRPLHDCRRDVDGG